MSDQLVNHLMDAQAANARQDRVLYDPSPAVDSALEHALVLLKTANDSQRPHAVALVKALGEVRHLNGVEREHERDAAAVADPVRNVHEFVKLARPLLADVAHPFVGPDKRRDRRAELHALFARTLPRTRKSVSARHLLGVSKYTTLLNELALWGMVDEVARPVAPRDLSVEGLGVTL